MKFKACILISNIDCKLLQYVRNVHNTTMTLKISNAMTNIYNSEHYSSIFKRHSERNKSAKQIDDLNYLSTLKFFSIICLPTASFQFSRREKSFVSRFYMQQAALKNFSFCISTCCWWTFESFNHFSPL